MSCQEFRSLHADYADGVLAEPAASHYRAHVESCADCARYDRIVRESLTLLTTLPSVSPSPDFHERLQHRLLHLQDEMARHDRFAGSGALASLAIAAAIALVAWGPLLVGGSSFETERVAVVDAAAEQIADQDETPMGWFASAPGMPVLDGAPSMSAAFPGPYSPLIVEEPVTGASRRAARAMFAAYFPAVE